MTSPNQSTLGAIIEATETLLAQVEADIAAGQASDGGPITQQHFAAANLARKELQATREAIARGDID